MKHSLLSTVAALPYMPHVTVKVGENKGGVWAGRIPPVRSHILIAQLSQQGTGACPQMPPQHWRPGSRPRSVLVITPPVLDVWRLQCPWILIPTRDRELTTHSAYIERSYSSQDVPIHIAAKFYMNTLKCYAASTRRHANRAGFGSEIAVSPRRHPPLSDP